jgi:hypothetical protein
MILKCTPKPHNAHVVSIAQYTLLDDRQLPTVSTSKGMYKLAQYDHPPCEGVNPFYLVHYVLKSAVREFNIAILVV